MKVLRVWGNSNPSGIVINEGWFALAAAIIGDLTVEEALRKVCDMQTGGNQRWQPGRGKEDLILEMHAAHPELSNTEIALKVGCTTACTKGILICAGISGSFRTSAMARK